MLTLNLSDLLPAMTVGVFLLGSITFASGVITLITRTFGKEIRAITAQTTQLAKKGITDDVAGLVGNASSLMTAIGDLVHTSAGIGAFLTVLGLLMIAAAFVLIFYI